MLPVNAPVPGEPQTPEPPEDLVKLSENIVHPLVHRTGITCTSDGHWALYVTVSKGTTVPLHDLEERSLNYPVIYEAEPDEPLRPFGD